MECRESLQPGRIKAEGCQLVGSNEQVWLARNLLEPSRMAKWRSPYERPIDIRASFHVDCSRCDVCGHRYTPAGAGGHRTARDRRHRRRGGRDPQAAEIGAKHRRGSAQSRFFEDAMTDWLLAHRAELLDWIATRNPSRPARMGNLVAAASVRRSAWRALVQSDCARGARVTCPSRDRADRRRFRLRHWPSAKVGAC